MQGREDEAGGRQGGGGVVEIAGIRRQWGDVGGGGGFVTEGYRSL